MAASVVEDGRKDTNAKALATLGYHPADAACASEVRHEMLSATDEGEQNDRQHPGWAGGLDPCLHRLSRDGALGHAARAQDIPPDARIRRRLQSARRQSGSL